MNKNRSLFNAIKLIICVVIILDTLNLSAQNDIIRKNSIRYNLTNPAIFGSRSIIFGYERVLSHNQSLSVNIGQAAYPKLLGTGSGDTLSLTNSYKDKGFNFSLDYRFYLSSVNKYGAPRGVYIGPYYSYNYFKRTNEWNLNSQQHPGMVNTDLIIDIHTAGFQLGYQFIFWKRLSLDLVLAGPGVGLYSIKTKLSTNLDKDNEALLFDKINNYLTDKFPGYTRILAPGDFKRSGHASTTSIGYRYMVMLGLRF